MKRLESFENSLKRTKMGLFIWGVNVYTRPLSSTVNFIVNFIFFIELAWLHTDVIGEIHWFVEGLHLNKSFTQLSMIAPCTTLCLLATVKIIPLFYHRDLLVKIMNKLRQLHPTVSENHLNDAAFTDDYDAVDNFNRQAENDADILNDSRMKLHPNIRENHLTNAAFTNDYETGDNFKRHAENDADILNDSQIKNSELEKQESRIVKESTTFLNAVITLLYITSIVVTSVFAIVPIAWMVYGYFKDGKVELQLPFLIKYIFDPFTRTRWPFAYFHQVWSTTIVLTGIFSADSLLYAFCVYTQMHFRILGVQYENVVSWSASATEQRFVRLIKRHQELIKLVDDIEIIYSKSTLFNIISSSFLICLTAFNVTFQEDVGAVVAFLTFLVLSLSQIFLLCLLGDVLMRSSAAVSESAYTSRWYVADVTARRYVLFIIIRGQKPCKLTAANFTDLNLTTFTAILSRSWSYFALLKTMYK